MNQGGDKIIYKELSYAIVGFCYQTQEVIGRHGREKQYCDLLEGLLKENRISYEREKDLSAFLGLNKIGGNIVDFFIEGKILFDAKAKAYVTREDYRQMKRYLQASGIKLGIIVNFRDPVIRQKRILNSLAKE